MLQARWAGRYPGRLRRGTCGASGGMAREDELARGFDICELSCEWQAPTLKDALYGMPIGRLANTASPRLNVGLFDARLCEIS